MKNLKRNIIKASFLAASVLILSACGGEKWGIDNGLKSYSLVPTCSADARDSSAAIKVPAGTVTKALEADTTIRVWHYSNSDELICAITGSASIPGESI